MDLFLLLFDVLHCLLACSSFSSGSCSSPFNSPSDDESLTFKKMHEFSTVDGFVEVGESMAEMIKYVANEPSVGLFYVQQHIQHAVPNLVSLKSKVTDKSREMALHTEDSEDSIAMIKSMEEYGHSIANEMIKDIETSLALLPAKQSKGGLVNNPGLGFKIGRTRSWSPVAWGRNHGSPLQSGEKSTSYFSNVIKSAKEKASYLKWTQTETNAGIPVSGPHQEPPTPLVTTGKESSSLEAPEVEIDELPVSSPLADELQEEVEEAKSIAHEEELLSLAKNYNEFKADREAKLELWLAETRN